MDDNNYLPAGIQGHEQLDDMTIVEHGKFFRATDHLWHPSQLQVAFDLLAQNDDAPGGGDELA